MDLDLDSIDDIDDADGDALLVYVFDRSAGEFVWTWISRETLAESGRYDLAEYGL